MNYKNLINHKIFKTTIRVLEKNNKPLQSNVSMLFCALIIGLSFVFSCNPSKKEPKVDSTFLKNAEWYLDENNYNSTKEYQNKFINEYTQYIQKEKFEYAKVLLYNYGALVSDLYLYDSISYTYTQEYINQNYEVEKDTTYIMLYYICACQLSHNNQLKESIEWLQKTLDKNKTLKDKKIEELATNLLGTSYNYTNEPKKAIELFTKNIQISEQRNDHAALGPLYNNMAYAYDLLRAYNESEKMYKKSAYYFLKAKDSTNYFALQTTYANNHFGHHQDTLQTIKFIESIENEFKNYSHPSELNHSNINGIKCLKHYLLGQHDTALYYLNKSSDYYRKSGNNFYLIFNDMFEDEIYFDKYKKLKNKQQTIARAEEFLANNSKFECQEIYQLLYQNALVENNTKEALFYRNKEIELKESSLEQNQKGQLFEIDKKYQAAKNEKQIALQQAQISKNKSLIFGLFSILIIGISGTFLYFFRKRKKEAQAEMIRQEQFTFQLLQNTEEERSRIANELHDSVSHELLTIKNNLTLGRPIEAIDITNIIKEVRNISRNLHPAVLGALGLEAAIETLCDRLTDIGLFTTCEIDYTQKMHKNKELQIFRIIQEALNNTLKHGKANAAKVILTSQNKYLHLEVKDNGNGFDVNEQLNNPKSFGLQSIMQRAKAIAAKININSNNKGTIILLIIPT